MAERERRERERIRLLREREERERLQRERERLEIERQKLERERMERERLERERIRIEQVRLGLPVRFASLLSAPLIAQRCAQHFKLQISCGVFEPQGKMAVLPLQLYWKCASPV